MTILLEPKNKVTPDTVELDFIKDNFEPPEEPKDISLGIRIIMSFTIGFWVLIAWLGFLIFH